MWVRAKGASLTGYSLGSRDTERNATVSTSCKRFFTFREKGKEEKLICVGLLIPTEIPFP